MGAFGYLKVPFAFTQRFKYNKRTVQDPEAQLTELGDEVHLTFVWKKGKDGKLVHNGTELPQSSLEDV